MELKDFIKETLSQIIDAVSETQEKYKDKHVLICPDDIQSEKGEYYIDNESHYEYYNRKTKGTFSGCLCRRKNCSFTANALGK